MRFSIGASVITVIAVVVIDIVVIVIFVSVFAFVGVVVAAAAVVVVVVVIPTAMVQCRRQCRCRRLFRHHIHCGNSHRCHYCHDLHVVRRRFDTSDFQSLFPGLGMTKLQNEIRQLLIKSQN
jgi:hypothetical protein